ncbi:hypothetical protein [Paraburkholderia unamae]|uniref:hypothetical protein n=1 Tax=Paraburkholderia unamae TaxID=219649 RepID=UPI0011BFCE7B|nr:hypothetical protein [Paraburkholderia unamae]
MATRIIEGAAVRAATGVEAALAGRVPVQADAAGAHAASGLAKLRRLRRHKTELILLAVATGCVMAFALWLDGQLRPALDTRERNERAAEELHERIAPCLPSAGRSPTSWCGAVTIPPPPPIPVSPIPLIAGAPAAFCTANGSPSC